MRKRLFDGLDQGLGEEILLLENLSPPGGGGVYCSLCWALERVFGLVGQPVSYARLMGTTGTAFMVPLGDHLAPDWSKTEAQRHLPDVFVAVDARATREAEPGEPVLLSLCREQLLQRRPLAAQDMDGTWLAIVGVKGQELLVQVPDSPRLYERHSLQLKSVISLGDMDPDLPPLEAGLEALDRAWKLLGESQAQWLAWEQALTQPEPYGPELTRLERFAGEQLLTATVIDAREAAAGFLAAMAEETDFELAEALQAAAQAAEQVVLALEQLIASPEMVDAAHVAEDEAWLERRVETLSAAREADQRLADAIDEATDSAGELI